MLKHKTLLSVLGGATLVAVLFSVYSGAAPKGLHQSIASWVGHASTVFAAERPVKGVTTPAPAGETTADIAASFPVNDTIIAQASTTLPRRQNDVTNIHIASDAINRYVVLPGQTFSFNGITGYPTADKGYQPGPGISNGQVVPMLGGGICQVSTTLYDAVLQTNMQVTERHAHSLPVSYVPRGKDAMVYIEEGKDFQFRNTLSTPIVIQSALQNGKLVVTLWEHR